MLVLLLPLIFAGLGALAGPALARKNYTVALADQVAAHVAAPTESLSDELTAFRATGRSADELLDEARRIERTFLLGGALFGAWCGLVVAMKIAALGRVPRRTEYEIEQGLCMACGRCFTYCPRERLRLRQLAEGAVGDTPREADAA